MIHETIDPSVYVTNTLAALLVAAAHVQRRKALTAHASVSQDPTHAAQAAVHDKCLAALHDLATQLDDTLEQFVAPFLTELPDNAQAIYREARRPT